MAGPSAICQGGSTTLTVSGGSLGTGASWQWYSGGCGTTSAGSGTSITVTPSSTTTYYVRAEGTCNTTGCAGVGLTVHPTPVANFSAADVCLFDSASFIDQSTIGSGTITWFWQFGDSNTSTKQNPKHLYNNNGTYNVALNVTSNSGCIDSIAKSINIFPSSYAGILSGSQTLCAGQNSGVLNLLNYIGDSIAWLLSTDGGNTWNPLPDMTDTLLFLNIAQETRYRAIVSSGCPPDTSNIVILAVDSASAGGTVMADDTVCSLANYDTLFLTGSYGIILRWEFSTDSGNTWTNISNTTLLQSYNNLQQTTRYRALVKNGVCPEAYSAAAVISVDPPTAGGELMDNITVCRNQNTVYMNLVNYVGNILEWQFSTDSGNTWQSLALSAPADTLYDVSAKTWLRVTVRSGVCPEDTSTLAVISLYPDYGAYVSAGKDDTISIGETKQLQGEGGSNYLWQPGEWLSDSTVANPVASPESTVTFVMTATDINGCKYSDTVVITVVNAHVLGVSNLLTPNGDGKNDNWHIRNIGFYPDNQVVVYNSLGQTLYVSKGYQNDWDGTYLGKKLPDGTYYYVITFSGSEKVYKGTVTILNRD